MKQKPVSIILKETNNLNDFFMKTNTPNILEEARKEYYKNEIFFARLQEDCFGSVSKQIKE